MGNRKRLDPGVEEQVRLHIRELLETDGTVSNAQRRVIAELIQRTERSVGRYIAEEAAALGIELRAGNMEERQPDRGLDGLLSRGRFSFATDEMKKVALAYAGNLRALHRDAVKVADQLGLSGPVSYEWLTRKFNEELPAAERNLIRRGIAGFKSSALYVRWSAGYRNEVWQIDATQMDFWMRPKGTSQRIRPWALFIIDDFSRVILSASLMLHDYTAEDAAACVHRAMLMREVVIDDGRPVIIGGLPEKILCDNALQFTGQVMSHVALTLGFTMWAVAAYAGEKKGKVERVIRAANEDFARRLPGYANRNVKTASMRDALHAVDEQLLDEQQALDELGKWVEEWNNSPHPTVPGRSRYQVWADDTAGLQQVDPELLRPATVAKPRPRYRYHKDGFRVQSNGVQRFYVDTSLQVDVLGHYLLRYLPGNDDWVDAYTLDGRFVARCWDATLLDQETRQHVEAHRRDTYRSIASLRSEAVELRSLAAAQNLDSGDRPNPIATAHQQQALPATGDLVRASLQTPNLLQALPAGTDPADDSGDAAADPDGLDTDSRDTDGPAPDDSSGGDSGDAADTAAAPSGQTANLDDLAATAIRRMLADEAGDTDHTEGRS